MSHIARLRLVPRLALCLALGVPAVIGPGAAWAQDEGLDYDPLILETCLAGRQADRQAECIGIAADRCMATGAGGSNVGMGGCLAAEADQWDAALNASYASLLAQAEAADADLAQLGSAAGPSAPELQAMQRDWIAFRDSACGYEVSRWQGGSGSGPASQGCRLRLTAAQAIWLSGYAGTQP
ncbi:DUF1311 domain-containing protein [Paracoccus sp. M683]|uniref:lysozyme inhibitor LprI family protein n=1 Tax=Paracoccus sp. M683 TaxID=2594268 RepID=UPI00117FBA66|nr:lysozyme inhibitor LprI family protein [Paracoccus sp. M683]TRW98231.1 DUF1311 domain-containing protein [Paracoccus sp. M683]